MQEKDYQKQFPKKLGRHVRRLREVKGWSQEELARQAGLARSFVAAIESGRKNISLSTLIALAGTFDANLSTLVKGSDAE